ncbi:MAG: hypothetical protein RLZZ308_531 [Candidatus Parcubacteria bacterium]
MYAGCDAVTLDCETGALKAPTIQTANRIGTAHVSSRYNPNGVLSPSILSDGARDAYDLGFRSIKIWLDQELTNPLYYQYDASSGIVGGVTNPDYMKLVSQQGEFADVFSIPFQTYFLETDNFPGGWKNERFPNGFDCC